MDMTPPPPPVAPSLRESRRNPLAWIAFAFSMIGFCIPVLPSLMAIVIGVPSMFRRPRGVAVAAVSIAVLQLAVVLLASVVAVSVVRRVIAGNGDPRSETMERATEQLERMLADDRREGGARFAVGSRPKFKGRDAWGTGYRVEIIERNGRRSIVVWSAGEDRRFDTADDFIAADARDRMIAR